MTLLILSIGIAAMLLFFGGVVIHSRALVALSVPLVAAAIFVGTILAIDLEGYAVPSRYLEGREAIVLADIEGQSMLFFLVRFSGDSEPRLVSMPATDENKKAAEEAKQRAANGMAVIRFGAQPSRQGGAGGDHAQADGFQLLDPAQSRDFGKTR